MMGSGADLAVVIVNSNSGDDLSRCLGSLRRHQGAAVLDVLVIDNASTDGSHTRAASAHPWARLIRNPRNVFLSPAWNQGASQTDAPFLLFLNPATEWWKGTLGEYLRVARAHPGAGIVGPMVRDPDGRPVARGRAFRGGRAFAGGRDRLGALASIVGRGSPSGGRSEPDGWDGSGERTVDRVSGCCMLMPRDAFDAMGGFDEGFSSYAEELDMATRLQDAGWSVLFTPEVEILHDAEVSAPRARWTALMRARSTYRYYRKHRADGWRRLTLPVAWFALRVRAEIGWIRGRLAR